MTEITLKDGRIFNSQTANPAHAIANVIDYLFCEYDETITVADVAKVEIINK